MVSDSHTSEITPAKNRFKSDRRIIVIPEEQKGLKKFTRKLTQIAGANKIARGVFIVKDKNKSIRNVVGSIPHISFKKVREIPKIRDKSHDAILKRTYVLVTYHSNNPNPQQKKRIQRIINKSVAIRLRPGVLIFPHLRIKDNRKYFGTEKMTRLFNSRKFTTEIETLHADCSRFTHLRIVGPRSLTLITEALERMVHHKFDMFDEKTRILRDAVKNPDISSAKLKKRYSVLFSQYKVSKTRYDAIQQIMNIKPPSQFKRLYDRFLRIRKMIAERQ